MNKRRLPEASRQFTDAIAMGGEAIRAYEKRRQARLRAGMLAAACAVILIGAGAFLFTHTRPRPDTVVLSADPGRLTSVTTAAPEVCYVRLTMSAVTGENDEEIKEAYTGLAVAKDLDLTKSPIKGKVSKAIPVEGTNRQYVRIYTFDHATLNGETVTAVKKLESGDEAGTAAYSWCNEAGEWADLTEDSIILLHYGYESTKT